MLTKIFHQANGISAVCFNLETKERLGMCDCINEKLHSKDQSQ